MLDVFQDDAFTSVNLTKAINLLPYVPNMTERLGMFSVETLTMKYASIEYKQGKLGLVRSRARGAMVNPNDSEKRKMRVFEVPHFPLEDEVMADDVDGVRAFGSEDAVEGIAEHVNNKMARMKQNIDITLEYQRVGALSGRLLDADGSTILDMYDEFGISEPTFEWDFTNEVAKTNCLTIIRLIEAALGATPYSSVVALCGNRWFDNLVLMDDVAASYETSGTGEWFRTQQANVNGNASPFRFGNIDFYNYRGKVGSIDFVADDEARFFVQGAPDLFIDFQAPAPFMETVNRPGQPFYAKQAPKKYDTGIDLHAEANRLFLCTRPGTLVKGTGTNWLDGD